MVRTKTPRGHTGTREKGHTRDRHVDRIGRLTIYKRGQSHYLCYRERGKSVYPRPALREAKRLVVDVSQERGHRPVEATVRATGGVAGVERLRRSPDRLIDPPGQLPLVQQGRRAPYRRLNVGPCRSPVVRPLRRTGDFPFE